MADPRGPAGAIAIGTNSAGTFAVAIPPKPDGYRSLWAAAEAVQASWSRRQPIIGVSSDNYETTADGRPCAGSVTVTVAETGPLGWTFFGWVRS